MRNKKTIMIGILCTLVAVMSIGYALLAQQLNINGRASIDSTWRVEITNITEKDIVGDASSKETPSYTSTTANFSVGLIQPGDSITYDIEISNLGTLKAKVDSINVTMDDNDAITYTTSGVQQGDKLGVGEKTTLSVKVEYNSNVTSQPTTTGKDLTVTINYVQDLGASNEPSTAYDAYSVGDQVSFAGSNWYVIKNSTADENYVTLMKEKILTSDELGEYAATMTCDESMVNVGAYGCAVAGEKTKETIDGMLYYYSDNCHFYGHYGYTDTDISGCNGHNDYEGSKVREFLEGMYINALGGYNLKEVDGYKVRLLTKEELESNGWAGNRTVCTGSCYELYGLIKDTAPTWVYQNFGEKENSVYGYWTMTPNLDYDSRVWIVTRDSGGALSYFGVSDYVYFGVRPVINLLKSSI